jgi:hypothetical protein
MYISKLSSQLDRLSTCQPASQSVHELYCNNVSTTLYHYLTPPHNSQSHGRLVFIYFLKQDFRVVRAVVFDYLRWVAVIYLRGEKE